MENIRNFCIIAHIDHGKSTLADRMLEITHTIETRKMRDQVLDSMDLERERGITIKMQPVRMEYEFQGKKYILNLIDTPGHIDFSYEVSRALKAVEGSILLIDSTQGVQAQTLTTLALARESGLKIIPVLSKIDSPLSRVEEIKEEVTKLLDCDPNEILLVSGRTGEGVENLLQEGIRRVPAPVENYKGENILRALVFDKSIGRKSSKRRQPAFFCFRRKVYRAGSWHIFTGRNSKGFFVGRRYRLHSHRHQKTRYCVRRRHHYDVQESIARIPRIFTADAGGLGVSFPGRCG